MRALWVQTLLTLAHAFTMPVAWMVGWGKQCFPFPKTALH